MLVIFITWPKPRRQAKLQFDPRHTTWGPNTGPEQMTNGSSTPDEPAESVEKKQLLVAVQQSLTSIENKMDNMCTRMDSITNKLEKHDRRIREAKQHLSTQKENISYCGPKMINMENDLKLIAATNEDHKARSRHNNLRILGVPEATSTGRMEDYVERMLTTLFGKAAFSRLLVVKQAHCSL
ncbi:hypothetical protein NDU88_005231 [Pleurodeles waltl]|uniref:Uncharacterized protein n=1 Tax=Pleurodeles waltl TaxID=8319 RepID=A0AAV7MC84_PLEWA|nr:hypothetical protein NDU88_005231 [Pleurodeles waltl]